MSGSGIAENGFDAQTSWQWRVREAARTEPWGHLFAPPGIIASWISPEWVETMRALLPPAAFDRVIANIWTSGSGDFVTREQWQACIDERLARNASGLGHRNVSRRGFDPARDLAKLPEHLTFHDLRHAAASRLIGAGLDPVTVAAVLGHEDATTTLRIYAHLFDRQE